MNPSPTRVAFATGTVVPIDQLSDPVFAGLILGDRIDSGKATTGRTEVYRSAQVG